MRDHRVEDYGVLTSGRRTRRRRVRWSNTRVLVIGPVAIRWASTASDDKPLEQLIDADVAWP
jgi:hypothetical protein